MLVEYGTDISLVPTGNRGDTTSRDSLRPPASIDEQCRYYGKPIGCRMGDRCAYRHSSYRTDEILRRRSYERQQQHTNLDVNRCVSEEEDGDSSVSDVYPVIRKSDSSSDNASELVEHRALARNGLADRRRRRRNMSADSMDGGNVVISLRDAHRYTPSDSEAKSDTEGELSPVSSEDERVYFYGAPGGFRAGDSDEEPDWRFAVASAIRLEERWSDDEAPTVHTRENPSDSQSSCSQPPRQVCHFFLNGDCTRDVQCRYAHPVETEELYKEQADDEPPPPDCGICLDNITKFGILTGCDHAFCLTCLGKWRRKGKAGHQIELTAVRGCPVCRKPSFFIIPSATFVTGKKKHKLIEAYKDNLAKIPCRNFKYNDPNSCPFGNSCFFLHQGPQV